MGNTDRLRKWREGGHIQGFWIDELHLVSQTMIITTHCPHRSIFTQPCAKIRPLSDQFAFFFTQLLGKIGNFMAMSSLAAGVGGLFWLETNIQLSRSLLEKLNMMSFIEN